jgi:Sulfotransferase domain
MIWLASFPRSGNTLTSHVLRCYGARVRTVYHVPPGAFPSVWNRVKTPLRRNIRQSLFVKTHELPSDKAPAIYVIREPRDAIVSYSHFLRAHQERFRTVELSRVMEMILAEMHYGGWEQHVSQWTQRPRTAVVRFEHLVADPFPVIARACKYIGLKPNRVRRALESFASLHLADPKHFRRGTVGCYRDEMPERLQSQCRDSSGRWYESNVASARDVAPLVCEKISQTTD